MPTKITVPVNTEVLRSARERAGFSIGEIEKEHKNIRLWENGKEEPSYFAIKKLANKYGVPSSYFLFSSPVEERNKQEKFRNLRKGKLPPKLIYLVNKTIRYQMDIRSVMRIPTDNDPHFSKLKIKSGSPEESARTVLSYLQSHTSEYAVNEKNKRLEYMRNAVEKMGVFVFKDDFSFRVGKKNEQSDEDGFCLYDRDIPIIMINNNRSKERQLFTLFHELFHILVGEDSMLSADDSFNEEIHANMFASELLLPEKSLRSYIRSKNLNFTDPEESEKAIRDIAKRYEVSRYVAVIKLYQINAVPERMKDAFLEQFRKENKKYTPKKDNGGNYYATVQSYLSPRYFNTVIDLYHNGNMTPVELGKYFSIKPRSAYLLADTYMASNTRSHRVFRT